MERTVGAFTAIAGEAITKGLRVCFTGTQDATYPKVYHLSADSTVNYVGVAAANANTGDIVTINPLFNGPVEVLLAIDNGASVFPGSRVYSGADGKYTMTSTGSRILCGVVVQPSVNYTNATGSTVNINVYVQHLRFRIAAA
jgi:hypothetical protein